MVPKNRPVKEGKWELKIANTNREKNEVCNMAIKEKQNPEENRDSMEAEVMDTRSGRGYNRDYDTSVRPTNVEKSSQKGKPVVQV